MRRDKPGLYLLASYTEHPKGIAGAGQWFDLLIVAGPKGGLQRYWRLNGGRADWWWKTRASAKLKRGEDARYVKEP